MLLLLLLLLLLMLLLLLLLLMVSASPPRNCWLVEQLIVPESDRRLAGDVEIHGKIGRQTEAVRRARWCRTSSYLVKSSTRIPNSGTCDEEKQEEAVEAEGATSAAPAATAAALVVTRFGGRRESLAVQTMRRCLRRCRDTRAN